MASLANQTISSTYDGLIKTSTDQPVPISGVQLLEDGVGNSLALSIGRANQGVTITGTVTADTVTGTISATSVLADGVTATTQSLGDNSTKVATTAYVDAQVTAEDLDFAGDSGTGAVDLDSQSLTIAGTANEIETSASGQTITIGLPNDISFGSGKFYWDASLDFLTFNDDTLDFTPNPNATTLTSRSDMAFVVNSNDGASNQPFVFWSGSAASGSEVMVIESTGNVGIGTSSPAVEMEIASAAPQIRLTDTDGGYCEVTNVGGNLLLQADKGNTEASSYMRFDVDGSERMRIDSSGNVGIGTNSPATPLDIFSSNAFLIKAVRNLSTDAGLQIGANNSGAFIDTVGIHEFAIQTNASERLRIDSSGNVGIGTSTAAGANGKGIAIYASDFPRLSFRNSTTGDTTNDGMEMYMAGLNFYHDLGEAGSQLFYTSGTERMRIDSSGNVGIGTSSPTARFDVNSGATNTVAAFRSTDAGAYIGIADPSTTLDAGYPTLSVGAVGNNLVLNTANTERMRVDSSGKVGIGTTSPANTLHVVSSSGFHTLDSVGGASLIDFRTTGNTTQGGVAIGADAVNTLSFRTASTERMIIDSSGNVGIGTSNPSQALHIGDGTASKYIRLQGSVADSYVGSDSTGTFLGNTTSYPIYFNTNSVERMRITSGGYLKASNDGSYISTAADWHEFTAGGTTWTLRNKNDSTNPYGLDIGFTGATPNNTTNQFLVGYDASFSRFIIYSNGDMVNRNGSYGSYSDIKLKENIVDATPKLDDLLQVKIRNYNLIGEETKQLGVVAQELEEVFPSMVSESPDYEEQEIIDEEGNVTTEKVDLGTTTKSVKYSVFVPMLIKAMQEQQEIINDLKARIETLENK